MMPPFSQRPPFPPTSPFGGPMNSMGGLSRSPMRGPTPPMVGVLPPAFRRPMPLPGIWLDPNFCPPGTPVPISQITKTWPLRNDNRKEEETNAEKPWLTEELKKEILKKRQLYKKAIESDDPDVMAEYQDHYKKLGTLLKNAKLAYEEKERKTLETNFEKPWITEELRKEILKKRQLYKWATESDDPDLMAEYHEHYKKLGAMLKKSKRDYEENDRKLQETNTEKPWLTTELRKEILKKRQLYKQATESNDPDVMAEYQEHYKKLGILLTKAKQAYEEKKRKEPAANVDQPWVNAELKNEILKKRKLFELAVATNDPDAMEACRHQRKKVKRLIMEAKQSASQNSQMTRPFVSPWLQFPPHPAFGGPSTSMGRFPGLLGQGSSPPSSLQGLLPSSFQRPPLTSTQGCFQTPFGSPGSPLPPLPVMTTENLGARAENEEEVNSSTPWISDDLNKKIEEKDALCLLAREKMDAEVWDKYLKKWKNVKSAVKKAKMAYKWKVNPEMMAKKYGKYLYEPRKGSYDADMCRKISSSPAYQLTVEIHKRENLRLRAYKTMNPGLLTAFHKQCEKVKALENKDKKPSKSWPSRRKLKNAWKAITVHVCHICDKLFRNSNQLDKHFRAHNKCDRDGCTFEAEPKTFELHVEMVHESGYASKIFHLNSLEDIEKWKEERKRNFPSSESIAKRQAEKAKILAEEKVLKEKRMAEEKALQGKNTSEEKPTNSESGNESSRNFHSSESIVRQQTNTVKRVATQKLLNKTSHRGAQHEHSEDHNEMRPPTRWPPANMPECGPCPDRMDSAFRGMFSSNNMALEPHFIQEPLHTDQNPPMYVHSGAAGGEMSHDVSAMPIHRPLLNSSQIHYQSPRRTMSDHQYQNAFAQGNRNHLENASFSNPNNCSSNLRFNPSLDDGLREEYDFSYEGDQLTFHSFHNSTSDVLKAISETNERIHSSVPMDSTLKHVWALQVLKKASAAPSHAGKICALRDNIFTERVTEVLGNELSKKLRSACESSVPSPWSNRETSTEGGARSSHIRSIQGDILHHESFSRTSNNSKQNGLLDMLDRQQKAQISEQLASHLALNGQSEASEELLTQLVQQTIKSNANMPDSSRGRYEFTKPTAAHQGNPSLCSQAERSSTWRVSNTRNSFLSRHHSLSIPPITIHHEECASYSPGERYDSMSGSSRANTHIPHSQLAQNLRNLQPERWNKQQSVPVQQRTFARNY